MNASRKRQAVARIVRRRDVREAGAMERAHQKVARSADAVAGEHAPGAVRPVRGGRQADEQQPRAGIAEAGDRLAPVGFVAKGPPLFARDLRAVAAAGAGTRRTRRSPPRDFAEAALISGHLVIWSIWSLIVQLDASNRPINDQITR